MKNLVPFMVVLILVVISAPGGVLAQGSSSESPQQALPSRADLVVPAEIWDRVRENVGYAGKPLGYTAEEMEHFRGSDCVLRVVEMLFRDITSVPQFSGRISDEMLADPANFAASTFAAYRTLDAYGARVMEYGGLTGWETDWIPQDAGTDAAFDAVLAKCAESGIASPINDRDLIMWKTLPEPARKLAVRIMIAGIEASPWLRESFDEGFYKDYFNVGDIGDIPMEDLYAFASAPWQGDDEEELTISPRESFEALDKFDMQYFATGSNEFMRMVHGAIVEYQSATSAAQPEFGNFSYCEIRTPLGKAGIFGPGNDRVEGNFSFVVNLGGDDTYLGKTAVPRSMDEPIGIVVDLGGDDTYDSGDLVASLGCGNHGIGAIFDLGGNDKYICDESGIASAWYGTGIVVDYMGDDTYKSRIWSQGAAHAGVGMLIDLEGNDRYDCIEQSQAFGSTYGMGILLDVTGDDIYFADPEGHVSEVFEGRTCNFAQGTGFGRRADFGDGHSLGGGVGLLIEGGGDDSYTGSVYSQGAGYWWSLGCLEDRAGNDTYRNEQYSCGSAPHFAIGSLVDFAGDDKYNVGNEDVERQIQGHARDASLAVFIDGSGNDEYFLPNLAAGSSDLNCLTLFWDRLGDDTYIADRNPPSATAFSFGDSTTYYERFYTFRDMMACVGVFLDTGGLDSYGERDPADAEAAAALVRIPFADNSEWRQERGPRFWGYGLDVGWYSILMPPL